MTTENKSKKANTQSSIDTLVVVKRYPSKDNLYEYTFVHARVKAYIKHGLNVTVFCLDNSVKQAESYTFEGAKVIRGGREALNKFVSNKDIKSIATHLLTDDMWAAIRSYAVEIPTYIWLHGSEIQDWTRRHAAYDTKGKRIASIKRYQAYYNFWRDLFFETRYKTHFIFVSQYFADETMDDMDINLPPEKYSVIHNFVNSDLFTYEKKSTDQRLNILSIRPFSSNIYGNDLTVAAISELANRPFFDELKFTIIGRGPLFQELTLPLKRYKNVSLREDFLTQEGVAKEHKKNGVFLVPSRADTQGVSRDEAMSSGLVPVTNRVAAIPEFLSEKEGFLAPPDDPKALADAIETLYKQPELFLRMSENAAKRVRKQSDFKATVQKEINLLTGTAEKREQKSASTFELHSTNREKILRDAMFELLEEYNELKKERWRKSHELLQVKSSKSYRVSQKATAPLRKIRSSGAIRNPKHLARELLYPDKKKIMKGKDTLYTDLYKSPASKQFYLKKQPKDVTIAAIMDDFTYDSFKHECNIVQLTPRHWQDELKSSNPDMLFIESAWRGKDALWTNTVAKIPDELLGIVKYCQKRGIPTVFWNKEDPVHTVHFMRLASLCDFVFTTDVDSIPFYNDILRHNRIFLLPFAAQPAFNNPIEKYDRKDKFNFAGSYYRRYKERCRDFKEVADAAVKFRSLDIYDRNYGKNLALSYQFPDEYKKYIQGSLPYSEIDKAYKGYEYAITMNTIKYSTTMFARRAFELLASNTVTVGNYSKGMKYFLGDLTISADNKSEILQQLERVASTDLSERKYKLLGLRRVLEQHTYEERLGRILSKVFTDYPAPSRDKHVGVVAVVSQEDELKNVLENYNRQQYKDKRLYIIRSDESVKIPDGVAEQIIDAKKLGKQKLEKLFKGVQYIATFDPTMFYGKFYLTDLALATTYSGADVIGKSAYFTKSDESKSLVIHDKDSQYHSDVAIGITRSLISASIIAAETIKRFTDDIRSGKVYTENTQSIDGFNLCDTIRINEAEMRDIEGELDLSLGIDINKLYEEADKISAGAGSSVKAKLKKALRLRSTYPAQKDI